MSKQQLNDSQAEMSPTSTSKGPPAAASREGKVPIAGFFTREQRTALKVLAATEGRTIQELLEEAVKYIMSRPRGR